MGELHVLDFGDGRIVNLNWVTHTESRKVFVEETGEEYYEVNFFFAGGGVRSTRVKMTQETIDSISEAVA